VHLHTPGRVHWLTGTVLPLISTHTPHSCYWHLHSVFWYIRNHGAHCGCNIPIQCDKRVRIQDRVILVLQTGIASLIVRFDIAVEGRRTGPNRVPMRVFQPRRCLHKLAGLLTPYFVGKIVQRAPTLVILNVDTFALANVFTGFEEGKSTLNLDRSSMYSVSVNRKTLHCYSPQPSQGQGHQSGCQTLPALSKSFVHDKHIPSKQVVSRMDHGCPRWFQYQSEVLPAMAGRRSMDLHLGHLGP
jgi:hypothetical protein